MPASVRGVLMGGHHMSIGPRRPGPLPPNLSFAPATASPAADSVASAAGASHLVPAIGSSAAEMVASAGRAIASAAPLMTFVAAIACSALEVGTPASAHASSAVAHASVKSLLGKF